MRSTTPPGNTTQKVNDKMWRKYCAKVRQGWDFGICLWGAVGRQEEVSIDMPGQRMLICDVSEHKKVKEILEDVDWKAVPSSWMGAPNMDPKDVVRMYEEKKQEWIANERL